MQQPIHGDQVADRRDPAEDGPTTESIARARAVQQRERATFTETTGVRLNDDGQADRRRVLPCHRMCALAGKLSVVQQGFQLCHERAAH